MIGFDLDGVIAVEKKWWSILYRTFPRLAVRVRDSYKPQYIPEGDFVIVTNRPEVDRVSTCRWLSKNGVYHKGIYFSPTADPDGAYFKESVIKSLKLTGYVESDYRIYYELTKHCRETEVILWHKM